jgi:hypothetical protein
VDAQAELDRAPFFVKGPAKEGAEKYAREQGATEVTLVRAHVCADCTYVHTGCIVCTCMVHKCMHVYIVIAT